MAPAELSLTAPAGSLTSIGLLVAWFAVSPLPAQVDQATASMAKAVQAGSGSSSPADSTNLRIDPNTVSSRFAGVGSLNISSNGSTLTGSAVAISPWWVLTAGHNLDTNDNGQVDPGIQITFTLNFGSNQSHAFSVSQYILNPGFSGFLNPTVNGDLALLRLSQALPASLPIYSLWTAPVSVGQEFTVAGYGQSGSGDSGYTVSASTTTKRVGGNVVDSFWQASGHNEVFIYDFDSPSTYGAAGGSLGNAWETLIGPGDSGGPMFVDSNGILYIAGINTFTMGGNNGRFGDEGGGILVAPYLDWIQSTAAIPEPEAIPLLLGLGAFAAMAWHRFARNRGVQR